MNIELFYQMGGRAHSQWRLFQHVKNKHRRHRFVNDERRQPRSPYFSVHFIYFRVACLINAKGHCIQFCVLLFFSSQEAAKIYWSLNQTKIHSTNFALEHKLPSDTPKPKTTLFHRIISFVFGCFPLALFSPSFFFRNCCGNFFVGSTIQMRQYISYHCVAMTAVIIVRTKYL